MSRYLIASQVFLGLALAAMLGWILVRFTGPVLTVSHEGLQVLTFICLLFSIAASLAQLALTTQK